MKYYKISSDASLKLFYQSVEDFKIMSKELVIVDLAEVFFEAESENIIKLISSKTTRTCIAIKPNQLISFDRVWNSANVAAVVLKVDLDQLNKLESPLILREIPFEIRSEKIKELVTSIKMVYEKSPSTEVFVEFSVNTNSISTIFSAVMAIEPFNVSRIFIDPMEMGLSSANLIQDQFKNLEIYYGPNFPKITFSPHHPLRDEWNATTLNEFHGPSTVEIDLCNSCNHSCTFCSLYAEPSNSPEIQLVKQHKAPYEKVHEIVNSLPDDHLTIVLGGVGEPMLHPRAMEIISLVRERGFKLKIYSNLSTISDSDVGLIHHFSGERDEVQFVVNLSGITPEVFIKTRPRQNKKDFQKVITTIKAFASLKQRDGFGVHLTIMTVVNRYNFHQLVDFVSFANRCGAVYYPKPLEIHGNSSLEIQLSPSMLDSFHTIFNEMLVLAKLTNTDLELTNPFDLYKEKFFQKSDLIEQTVKRIKVKYNDFLNSTNQNALPKSTTKRNKPRVFEDFLRSNYSPSLRPNSPSGQDRRTPCYIAFFYIRIFTDLTMVPCCISTYKMPKLSVAGGLWALWSSREMSAFRRKMSTYQHESLHSSDPEWAFCQQCNVTNLNRKFHNQSHR